MGEVVDVADGYARNYLIPRGKAVGVTRGRLKEIEERKKVLDRKAARRREKLEGVADKIKARQVVIKARCSASGKLFGSVTNRQLAEELQSITGEDVDRHGIVLEDRIRNVGVYTARVKLHHDVEFDLEFEVEGEGFVPEEPIGEPELEPSVEAGDLQGPAPSDSAEPQEETSPVYGSGEEGAVGPGEDSRAEEGEGPPEEPE